MTLAALGTRLRAAGLTPRALAAWAGTDRLAALPGRLPLLAAREPVPAAAALLVFVAGVELPVDLARGLPLEQLLAAGLLERAASHVRAPAAVLPLGPSLLVCDRLDQAPERELACWPDDSSHHLASALPSTRVARWLDLGCGSAFAQLARPGLAAELRGLDINPRAVHYARLGAELSGLTTFAAEVADVLAPGGDPRAELVTCNAPMHDTVEPSWWRRADPGFFGRLFAAIPARLAPGGLAVVHAMRPRIPDELPGERAIVTYTPPGAQAFAVLWWRPEGPERQIAAHRPLTLARPHLDDRDRDDALAGALG